MRYATWFFLLCSVSLAVGFGAMGCSGFPSIMLNLAPRAPAANVPSATDGLSENEYQRLLDGWREGDALRQAYLMRQQSSSGATAANVEPGYPVPAALPAESPIAAPSMVLVPDVRQLSYMQAVQRLEALGLRNERREETSPLVAAETVLSQGLAPGEEVAPRTMITLVVSLGNQVRVPQLYGLEEREGVRLLTALGLRVPLFGINYQGRNTDIPETVLHQVCVGCILSARPQAGTLVPVGSDIYIAVRSD